MASSSGPSPTPSFLPSRDLPPLKRSTDAGQAQAILRGLEALEVALRLTREEEVRLVIDDQDEEDTSGSNAVQRDTNGENEDEHEASGDAEQGHDEVERRYAQSWLTRIASGSVDIHTLDSSSSSPSDEPDLVDRAARALAALCGRPASSAQLTSFVFCTSSSSAEAVVARARIGDVPITADALGNRTWGAAPLLARRLVGRLVGGRVAAREKEGGKERGSETRVLELGAGTGLVGLALAASAASTSSSRQGGMHIDLTDYHPHVLANLDANAKLNSFNEDQPGEGSSQSGRVSVRVRKLDWQAIHESVQGTGSSSRYTSTAQTLPDEAETSAGAPSGSGSGLEQGKLPRYLQTLEPNDSEPTGYDVLITADCIYDVHHPTWIRSVAERYLSRPSPDDGGGGVLWLITPLRETHKAELQAIYDAFPLVKSGEGAAEDGQRELRLCITWQGDEVGYDDFGPKSLWGGGAAGGSRSGLRTTYRTFEVRWV